LIYFIDFKVFLKIVLAHERGGISLRNPLPARRGGMSGFAY
jgi:hypothetical protein